MKILKEGDLVRCIPLGAEEYMKGYISLIRNNMCFIRLIRDNYMVITLLENVEKIEY